MILLALLILSRASHQGLRRLAEYRVNGLDELGDLGIRLFFLIKELHISGYVHGNISLGSVWIAQNGSVYLDAIETDIIPVPTFQSMRQDLLDAIHLLESVPRGESIRHTPVELLVLRRRLNRHGNGVLDYDSYFEILSRLIQSDFHESVKLYYRQLSVEELLVDAKQSDTCVLPVFKVVGKSSWFFRIRIPDSPSGCKQFMGYSLTGSWIEIKLCPFDDARMLSIKEATVLEILKEVKGVPPRYILLANTHTCRASVLLTKNSLSWIGLDHIGLQNTRWVTKLGIALLELIKAVHEKGFLHGSIHISKIYVKRFSKNPREPILVDWSTAQPWRGSAEPSGDPNEDVLRKSPFGTSRRDDVYRIAEVLMIMIGEPQFVNFHSNNPDLETIITMKKERKLESTRMTQMCFVQLYNDVSSSDALKYGEWIDCFRKQI